MWMPAETVIAGSFAVPPITDRATAVSLPERLAAAAVRAIIQPIGRRMTMTTRTPARLASPILLMLAATLPASAARANLAPDAPPPLVAVFPIEIADTSGEPPNPQWPERVTAVTHELARQLAASGQYREIELPSATGQPGDTRPVYRCDGCWRAPALAAGADAVAIAVVHKTSTLISSLHIWLLDVATQQTLRRGAVSLRGDTEEAWRRAVDFLLRRGILNADTSQPLLSSPFPGG